MLMSPTEEMIGNLVEHQARAERGGLEAELQHREEVQVLLGGAQEAHVAEEAKGEHTCIECWLLCGSVHDCM